MRNRILASVAVAAAVALGATGCEFMTTAETNNIKDISDGININVGSLKVQNALLITTNSGRNARFIATVVNQTNSAEELTIQAKDNTNDETTVQVPANSTLDLAHSAAADRVVFRNVKVTPGGLTDMFFIYPSHTGVSAKVPVLTGALSEYATLVPTSTPSPSSSATSVPGASDSATATPGSSASATPSPSATASSNG